MRRWPAERMKQSSRPSQKTRKRKMNPVTATKRSASAPLRHRPCVFYSSYLVSTLSPIAQDSKAKKKAKKAAGEGGNGGVYIEMSQHVSLTFSLKYLVNFSKSAALSDTVQLMLKNDVPLLVRIFFSLWKLR